MAMLTTLPDYEERGPGPNSLNTLNLILGNSTAPVEAVVKVYEFITKLYVYGSTQQQMIYGADTLRGLLLAHPQLPVNLMDPGPVTERSFLGYHAPYAALSRNPSLPKKMARTMFYTGFREGPDQTFILLTNLLYRPDFTYQDVQAVTVVRPSLEPSKFPSFPEDERETILKEGNPRLLRELSLNPTLSEEHVLTLARRDDEAILSNLSLNPQTPPDLLYALFQHSLRTGRSHRHQIAEQALQNPSFAQPYVNYAYQRLSTRRGARVERMKASLASNPHASEEMVLESYAPMTEYVVNRHEFSDSFWDRLIGDLPTVIARP